MANVSFKRGRAANLPTTAQDGVFYLTTDTNRLYVGQGDKLAELNKYIRQVETVNNLPAPSDRAVGDFVHVKSGNMLLVCKDTTSTGTGGWTQVNSQDGDHDTYVTSISKARNGNNEEIDYVTSDATGITVQFNINQTEHNLVTNLTKTLAPIPVSFKIAASDITTANKVAVGIGATAVTSGGATVAVKGTGSDGSSVVLKPGSNVTINADSNNNVTIASKDTKISSIDVATASNGGLTFTVKNNDDSTAPGTLEKGLYYIINGDKCYNQAELDVYTTSQIDSKFKALNAMTYKGTIAATGGTVSKLPTDNVSVGDTYLVAATSGTYGGQVCRKGDLLIAQGTEDETGFIPAEGITWTYVPSGDDIDTTYKLETTDNTVRLVPSTNPSGNSGTVTIANQDKNINVTTMGNNGAPIIYIDHATKAVGTKSEDVAATAGGSFDVIGSITTDATGHVSNIITKSVTLPKDNNTTYSVGLTDNATNGTTIQLKAGGTGGNDSSINLKTDGNVVLTTDINNITLKHKTVATPVEAPEKDASGNKITTTLTPSGTFTAVTGVVTDDTGHATGYTTRIFKLPEDKNTTYSLTADVSTANNTTTITNTLASTDSGTSYGTFTLKSDSLSLSSNGINVTMDLNWGEF